MRAYTQGITKEEFVRELKAHQEADRFVKGTYWENGKGCAVGCSLESIAKLKGIEIDHEDHSEYEKHLGAPKWLAEIEDAIFEGLPVERSKTWPVEFGEAIQIGSDLDQIKTPFIIFVLESCLDSMDQCQYDEGQFSDVKAAIKCSRKDVKQMIEAQKSGDEKKIAAARSAAWSARSAARSAAESAARFAAESAAARSAAESARSAAESARSDAWSAAWSARSAAWSAARSAARSAAESARSAAGSAAWSARSAAYEKYADKLLELMRNCK